jgi:hypothetical protein
VTGRGKIITKTQLEEAAKALAPPKKQRDLDVSDISIAMPSMSRLTFTRRRRPEPEPASPPRPEKTFTTMMDYLVGTDDLAKIASISGVMYYSPGFILTVLGLQRLFMKYSEQEGNEYVLNLRRLDDEEEREAALNVVSLYDLYLWVLRTSPSMARMVFNLQKSFQPPSVSSQIVEEYGRRGRAGVGAVMGGEEQVKKIARQLRREEEEEAVTEGEAYG